MNRDRESMSFFSNPAYIVPAVILGGFLLYFLYYATDKIGLETHEATAIVTAKDHTLGATTYVNRIAGGRSWTQAQEQPDFYSLSLTVENEPTGALVTKEKFDRLRVNDRVRVTFRRTRISGRLEVVDMN